MLLLVTVAVVGGVAEESGPSVLLPLGSDRTLALLGEGEEEEILFVPASSAADDEQLERFRLAEGQGFFTSK